MTAATIAAAIGSVWMVGFTLICKTLLAAHATTFVQAAAAFFPPRPPDPREPTRKEPTTSAPATRSDEFRGVLPTSLLVQAHLAADRGARTARARLPFSAFGLMQLPGNDYTANDLAFLAWASRLGYREGLEVSE